MNYCYFLCTQKLYKGYKKYTKNSRTAGEKCVLRYGMKILLLLFSSSEQTIQTSMLLFLDHSNHPEQQEYQGWCNIATVACSTSHCKATLHAYTLSLYVPQQ